MIPSCKLPARDGSSGRFFLVDISHFIPQSSGTPVSLGLSELCILFCSRLVMEVSRQQNASPCTLHITICLQVCSRSGFDLKVEPIQRNKKLVLFFFYFFCLFSISCIHLYQQTQQSEPILIWPCSLLSSPYWKSKYSHSDKRRMERSAFTHDVR